MAHFWQRFGKEIGLYIEDSDRIHWSVHPVANGNVQILHVIANLLSMAFMDMPEDVEARGSGQFVLHYIQQFFATDVRSAKIKNAHWWSMRD